MATNLSVPYEYYQISEGVKFFTEHGKTYTIAFRDASPYFGEEYQILIRDNLRELLFEAEGGQPHIYDPRVPATIMHVVHLIMSDIDRALFYFCDFADGKESARARLFEQWVNNDPIGNMTLIKRIIKTAAVPGYNEAGHFYFGLLCNSKSILYPEYLEMFDQFESVYAKDI